MYWHGTFSVKQALGVKSFLATQDLENSELLLWLDGESGYAGHHENPLLKPYIPFVRVRRFDAEVEARDTPLEGKRKLYREVSLAGRSDFVRFVLLFKYGGIYADIDTMFLRDMQILLRNRQFQGEFCYRWSAHMSYANTAVLRLRPHSETANKLLERCGNIRSCLPRKLLQFGYNRDLDLLVLPCSFFDPLWPHSDGQDSYEEAPFHEFADFFRRFNWRFRPKVTIQSYRDFFPGAFAYHWHNFWDAPESKDSYFGLFNQEFDRVLRDRLGIEIPRLQD
jgi:hypothetical protein